MTNKDEDDRHFIIRNLNFIFILNVKINAFLTKQSAILDSIKWINDHQ